MLQTGVTDRRTCDECRLVGVAAQRGDCSGNIDDQIRLFGLQASAVQVPGADTRPLSAPVAVVNAAPQKTHI